MSASQDDTRPPLPPQLQALVAQSAALRMQLDALDAVVQAFAAGFLAQMARAGAEAEQRARATRGQTITTFDGPASSGSAAADALVAAPPIIMTQGA